MIKVTAVGRVTRDVELAKTKKGQNLVNFEIASRGIRGNAEYLKCMALDSKAVVIAKYCKKGTLVFVSGIFTNLNEDDSNKRPITLCVNEVEFCGNEKDIDGQESGLQSSIAEKEKIGIGLSDVATDDTLPF